MKEVMTGLIYSQIKFNDAKEGVKNAVKKAGKSVKNYMTAEKGASEVIALIVVIAVVVVIALVFGKNIIQMFNDLWTNLVSKNKGDKATNGPLDTSGYGW